MRRFEQDWLELGSRVARSLHYQHRRNLRLLDANQAKEVSPSGMRMSSGRPGWPFPGPVHRRLSTHRRPPLTPQLRR